MLNGAYHQVTDLIRHAIFKFPLSHKMAAFKPLE